MVVLLLVPPVPIFLLIGFVALLQILMFPVGFLFPLVVVDRFASDGVVVVVIRIVIPRMYRATSSKGGDRYCCRE